MSAFLIGIDSPYKVPRKFFQSSVCLGVRLASALQFCHHFRKWMLAILIGSDLPNQVPRKILQDLGLLRVGSNQHHLPVPCCLNMMSAFRFLTHFRMLAFLIGRDLPYQAPRKLLQALGLLRVGSNQHHLPCAMLPKHNGRFSVHQRDPVHAALEMCYNFNLQK